MKRIFIVLLMLFMVGSLYSQVKYRKAVFYHHSTGGCFYDRRNLYDSSTPTSTTTVPKEIITYNATKGYTGTNVVSMAEKWVPSSGDNNWSDWASIFTGNGSVEYTTYPVIIIKTCYIQQQSMHSSSDITALKASYRTIVSEMAKHPNNFFVIWNNTPAPTDGNSDRAMWSAQFSVWCKDVLATGNDVTFGAFPKNVYVFDIFRKLANATTGYCDPSYGDPGDDHPSSKSVNLVTPQFVTEVFNAALVYEKSFTSVGESSQILSTYALEQNYPNPFNPSTTITYNLTKNESVKFTICDMLGKVVYDTPYERQNIGKHAIIINGSLLASGTYVYTLQTESMRISKRMVLVK